MKFRLLNIDQNAKTVKGQKKGYMTAILYLAPADLSGYEVCPMRSEGCTAGCLNKAGNGFYPRVQESRIKKTKWYFEDREGFLRQLVKELTAFIYKSGLTPVVRLNGTSDIPWERVPVTSETTGIVYPNVMSMFPRMQFYDYTKIKKRAIASINDANWPKNYHLTFSLTEANDKDALEVIQAGGNVAAVYSGNVVPPGALFLKTGVSTTFKFAYGNYTVPVVDGDEDDLRHKDARGVIVALKAKGKARKDTSGFVREIAA